jgi:hypothetical protein
VLLQVRALFTELLDDIYEQAKTRAVRLAALRDARDVFKRPSPEDSGGTGSAGAG